MDFGSCLKVLGQIRELKKGFLLLGCFSTAFSCLGLFLMFGLGFKYLQFAWHGKGLFHFLFEIRAKSGNPRTGFSSKKDLDQVCDKKIISCDVGSVKSLENSNGSENSNVDAFDDDDVVNDDDDDDSAKKCYPEDEDVDVMALRRLVKFERHRADMANLELEKERLASASAADEVMMMILRLQREKSCINIEANHHYRLAEQMQEYDHEIIQSLQLIVLRLESEKSLLEKKLQFCKEQLKQHMNVDEIDQFEIVLNVDGAIDDGSEDAQSNSVAERDS